MKICPQCQTSYSDDVEFCANDGMKLRKELSSTQDPMLGRVLDNRWIIDSKIGEGGMGSVYLGRQRSVNRKVAIKTLKPELVTSSEFVDRFFREAQIATTINHPNCVTILDFGQEDDNVLFLAMEYLEGLPLAERIQQQPSLTLEEILTITDQVSAALEAAHSHQIIHRDLKPDNIFLQHTAGHNIHAKLLDFGIAKDANASTQFTRTGQIFGTPDYMSPEQCGGNELDGRSDLYSLGCILYEMLCGAPPFENPNSMATLMAHVTEKPRHPSELSDTPSQISDLTLKLLAKEPSQRHASATELRQHIADVRAALSAQGISTAQAAQNYAPVSAADAFADTMATPSLTPPAPQSTVSSGHKHTISTQHAAHDEMDTDTSSASSKTPLILGLVAALIIIGGVSALALSFMSDTSEADDIQQPTPAEKAEPVTAAVKAEPAFKKGDDKTDTPKPAAVVKEKPATPKPVTTPKDTPPKELSVKPDKSPQVKTTDTKAEPPKTATAPTKPKTPTRRPKKTSSDSPASSDIPVLTEKIKKNVPKLKKKVKTKSDQIVDDLFK